MNTHTPDSQTMQCIQTNLEAANSFIPLDNSTLRTTPTVSSTKGSQHIHALSSAQIQDVWEDNLDTEFRRIMKLAQHYRWIALVTKFSWKLLDILSKLKDTEFPGVVYRPNESESLYNVYFWSRKFSD